MAASSLRQLDADFDKIQKKLQEGWARQKHLSEQFTAKLKGGEKEGHIGLIESQRLRVKNKGRGLLFLYIEYGVSIAIMVHCWACGGSVA